MRRIAVLLLAMLTVTATVSSGAAITVGRGVNGSQIACSR